MGRGCVRDDRRATGVLSGQGAADASAWVDDDLHGAESPLSARTLRAPVRRRLGRLPGTRAPAADPREHRCPWRPVHAPRRARLPGGTGEVGRRPQRDRQWAAPPPDRLRTTDVVGDPRRALADPERLRRAGRTHRSRRLPLARRGRRSRRGRERVGAADRFRRDASSDHLHTRAAAGPAGAADGRLR